MGKSLGCFVCSRSWATGSTVRACGSEMGDAIGLGRGTDSSAGLSSSTTSIGDSSQTAWNWLTRAPPQAIVRAGDGAGQPQGSGCERWCRLAVLERSVTPVEEPEPAPPIDVLTRDPPPTTSAGAAAKTQEELEPPSEGSSSIMRGMSVQSRVP